MLSVNFVIKRSNDVYCACRLRGVVVKIDTNVNTEKVKCFPGYDMVAGIQKIFFWWVKQELRVPA